MVDLYKDKVYQFGYIAMFGAAFPIIVNSAPYTLNPGLWTLHPEPLTLDSQPYTRRCLLDHRKPYTLHPAPLILDIAPYTLDPTY